MGRPSDGQTAGRQYNLQLEKANLGSKQIKSNGKKGDHEFFIKKICEEFPPLKTQNGAIMLWKCNVAGSHSRPLDKVIPGPNGYSIPFLRERPSSCNKIYVTPIQLEILNSAISITLPNTCSATAKCSICNLNVTLSLFSDHLLQCSSTMLQMDPIDSRNGTTTTCSIDLMEVAVGI